MDTLNSTYTRSFIEFEESTVETFMGGNFKLSEINCLGHLRSALKDMLKELETWGDDAAKCHVDLDRHFGIMVDLEEGIVQ